MNILHVWDQSGVACVLSKYQRQLGHNVSILKREGYDPFKIFSFYNEPLIDLDGKKFINLVIDESKNYDVIHIHSLYKIVPYLRNKYKNKFIILHYHGSELRNGISNPSYFQTILHSENKSDLILLSTPDLIGRATNKAVYIENPIDLEHFKPITGTHLRSKFLTIKTGQINIDKVIEYLRLNDVTIEIEIHDRINEPISYADMPSFLSHYMGYVDIRFINNMLIESLSKTALEALACNLKILSYDLSFIYNFPITHKPENVVNRIMSLINSSVST